MKGHRFVAWSVLLALFFAFSEVAYALPASSSTFLSSSLQRISDINSGISNHSSTSQQKAQVQFLHQAIALSAVEVDAVLSALQLNQTIIFKGVGYGKLTGFQSVTANVTYTFTLLNSKTQQPLANLGATLFDANSKQSLLAYSVCITPPPPNNYNCTSYKASYISLPVNMTQPKEYGYDIAKVKIVNLSSRYPVVEVWGINTNCYECLLLPLAQLDQTSSPIAELIVETHHSFQWEFRVLTNSSAVIDFEKLVLNPAIWQLRAYWKEGFFTTIGSLKYFFGEYGVYTILLFDSSASPSSSVLSVSDEVEAVPTKMSPLDNRLVTVREADDAFLPIYIAIAIYAGVFVVWLILSFIYDRVISKKWHLIQIVREEDGKSRMYFFQRKDEEDAEEDEDQKKKKALKTRGGGERVNALDAFRGFAIVIMIFVNYGGGGYWFFNHAKWYGLTVADLVFPWFIWIMGTSMALSFDSLEKKGTPFLEILYKSIRRSVILFGLGLLLINNGYDYKHWRIPGVLQRFGVSYFFVSLTLLIVPRLRWEWLPSCGLLRVPYRSASVLGLHSESEPEAWDWDGSINQNIGNPRKGKGSKGGFNDKDYSNSLLSDENSEDNELTAPSGFLYDWFRDVIPYVFHWIAALSFLAIYFLLTFFLDVPDCGRGYLGPGGLAQWGKYENCTGGAAKYIDEKVFGSDHIYTTPTAQDLYHTGYYDPEGLLGCLTSIFLVFLGVQSGRIIGSYKATGSRVVRWLVWGVGLGGIALALCGASKAGGWMPVAKNLWSASFICATGGGAFLLLALFYVLIDVLKVWNGSPFRFVGMNPILIYCGHEVLGGYVPFSFMVYGYFTHSIFLAMNLVGVTCWCFIAYYMYWNNFFISI